MLLHICGHIRPDQSQRRLRELESQLESMRDRLRDYVRMQRLRAQDDARIRQLQTEIDAMRRQRVAVQKQIRDQSDKHRGFLHEAETQARVSDLRLQKHFNRHAFTPIFKFFVG